VPGFRKQGLTNEKNCVSLVLVTPDAKAHSIPRQLVGFDEVVQAVRDRASYGVERVLVGSLFDA
jgi:hypothetical protein